MRYIRVYANADPGMNSQTLQRVYKTAPKGDKVLLSDVHGAPSAVFYITLQTAVK